MKRLALKTAAVFIALASAAHAQEPVENTVVTQDARAFFVVSDPIKFAVVSGDLQAGPQSTFGRFPANFETPNHTHSHAYRAVVISGEMTNPFDGETTPPTMKAGSFWSVAAGAKHSTACVSSVPCEFFMFADEGFDFTPVD